MHDKSTSGEAQRARILKALAMRPHNSYELRKMGCYQANTRILELRRQGHDISTQRVSIWDDEGYRHDGIAFTPCMGAEHERLRYTITLLRHAGEYPTHA